MELFINDTIVGVTPKDGDTIQSLLSVVSKELDQDLIIATMMIDGEYKSIDDPIVLNILVSNVNKVELVVATKTELGVSLIDSGKQFLIIGAQELKNGSLVKKSELVSSFAWILESLEALKSSLTFPPADISILKAILTELLKKIDNGDISLNETKEIGAQLEKLSDLFDVLKFKIMNENQFSKENTYALLKDIHPKLPDIATNFQVANDLSAIQELCKIIDIIETFIRFASMNTDDHQIEQHALALKDISLQMLQAFENKDFILIADIIEYDLSEQIESMIVDDNNKEQ